MVFSKLFSSNPAKTSSNYTTSKPIAVDSSVQDKLPTTTTVTQIDEPKAHLNPHLAHLSQASYHKSSDNLIVGL